MSISRLVAQYKKIYGEELNPWGWSEKEMKTVLEWCDFKKEEILLESDFNTCMKTPDYAKLFILEAIARKALIEIAPKRIKRRKKVAQNG